MLGESTDFFADDPPYFLSARASASPSWPVPSDAARPPAQSHSVPAYRHQEGVLDVGAHGSDVDAFRSVIDDLTIENRKLKERLRRYEQSYDMQLERDKLFEVKIHGLAPRKKRELEETLRVFASSIDGADSHACREAMSQSPTHSIPVISKERTSGSSFTSNSRPLDSAYASMSASEPTSMSRNLAAPAGKKGAVPMQTKDHYMRSFLQDIPRGLLPKNPHVMTERAKKKLVVRKLERLFTGKKISIPNGLTQPQQQQEVSHSAAEADRLIVEGHGKAVVLEGLREAQISTTEMEPMGFKHGRGCAEPGYNYASLAPIESESESVVRDRSQDQRPTRPLDLDPDRAQIPAENVEYIRHLGLSIPRLMRGPSADAEGWVYLNLLINMAQLHIINVTPDFVRRAVADVSAKFEISSDGRKLRWGGGSEGTKMSSESGESTAYRGSQDDSDSSQDVPRKRRKLMSPQQHLTSQQSEDIGISPACSLGQRPATLPTSGVGKQQTALVMYKPLFRHRSHDSVDSTSEGDASSRAYSTAADDSLPGRHLGCRHVSFVSGKHSLDNSSNKQKRGDGTIAFYSGANFCTDLTGDRGDMSTALRVQGGGQDGYSNNQQNALGSTLASAFGANLRRTSSGSLLTFRPFKDYSIETDALELDGPTQLKSPELAVDDTVGDLDFSPKWNLQQEQVKNEVLEFEASGLGGTLPADHFCVSVATRHPIYAQHPGPTSAPSSAAGASSLGGSETSPGSRSSKRSGVKLANAEDILAKLHNRRRGAPPASRSSSSVSASADRSIMPEIIATSTTALPSSTLPPPSSYFTPCLSSSSSSPSGTSSAPSVALQPSLAHGNSRSSPHSTVGRPTFRFLNAARHRPPPTDSDLSYGYEEEHSDGEDEEDEDSDESIDMLATARGSDPEAIAAQERAFEAEWERERARETTERGRLRREDGDRSSAATLDEGSRAWRGDEGTDDEESSGDEDTGSGVVV